MITFFVISVSIWISQSWLSQCVPVGADGERIRRRCCSAGGLVPTGCSVRSPYSSLLRPVHRIQGNYLNELSFIRENQICMKISYY